MLVRDSIARFSIKELSIALVTVSGFLLITGLGGLASLQLSKQQFEAEAQNIAAVIRSRIDVAEGLVTSLDASDYSSSDTSQLQSHFSNVLSNYGYVTGLGRFESLSRDQVLMLEKRSRDAGMNAELAWYFDKTGSAKKAGLVSGNSSQLALTVFKSRYVTDAETHTDLTGADLTAVTDPRTQAALGNSSQHSIISSIPPEWRRPGEILLFRSTIKDKEPARGYVLELDLNEMESSGGVELNHFDIELGMFSDQGEFATESYVPLHSQKAALQTHLNFDGWFKANKWLSTFSIGDKTILLKVSRPTGLSARMTAALLLIGAFLSSIFLTILHLARKRRHALRLRRIESEKLYHARYRAAVTLASIDDAVVTTDVNENILYVNEAAEKLLGYAEGEIQGKNVDSVIVHTEEDGNLVLYAADDSKRYINKKQSPLKDLNGDHTGHVIVLRDISTEHSLTQELKHKVNHDLLTGLSNRLNFENQLQQLVSPVEQTAGVLDTAGHVLCFIDLDRFKEVNDTCGHDAGDELLVRVAEMFSNNVRENDLVARLGGDEFGIVLRNITRDAGRDVTDRLKKCFQSFYFNYGDHVFPVRCSIGFVHFMPDESNFHDVTKSADAACFDAKNLGRNSVCERSAGDSAKQNDQGSMWLPRLNAALESGSFELLTQPVVSLQDGSCDTHEVLLRLVEDGKYISPNSFLKAAVRYEIAESIDRWVVQNILSKLSSLRHECLGDKFVINLSSQSIQSEEFQAFLIEEISMAGIDPARLCFDIKESDLLSKPAESEEFCRVMRSVGCDVALDDFGAGMTSFSLLKTIPITTLKIDGSLISNLDRINACGNEYNADQAMVKSIYSFASSMGLSVIAEQVESVKCLEVLRNLGIGYAQGSAVEREVPFETLLADDGLNRKAA